MKCNHKESCRKKRLENDVSKFVGAILENLEVLTTQRLLFIDHNLCSVEWDTLRHCMKVNYSGFSFRDVSYR